MAQWYNVGQAFEILGIEPTTDRRIIKRTYSQLVKKYHPEEYPEEWQRIHDAYETAINSIRQKEEIIIPKQVDVPINGRKSEPVEIPTVIEEQIRIELPSKKESSSEKINQSELIFRLKSEKEDLGFEQLSDMAQRNREKQGKELEQLLLLAESILEEQCSKPVQTSKQWKKLLTMPQIQAVRTDSRFLLHLGDTLSHMHIGPVCYSVIKRFLFETYEELGNDSYSQEWKKSREDLKIAYLGAQKAVGKVKLFSILPRIGRFCVVLILIVARFVTLIFDDSVEEKEHEERLRQIVYENRTKQETVEYNTEIVREKQEINDFLTKYANEFPEEGSLLELDRRPFDEELKLSFECILVNNLETYNVMNVLLPEELKFLSEDGEKQVIHCFYISGGDGIDDVGIYISLEEIGIMSGQYELWQHDGKQYQKMNVTICQEDNLKSLKYPFEASERLFLRTKIYGNQETECFPIVIFKNTNEG